MVNRYPIILFVSTTDSPDSQAALMEFCSFEERNIPPRPIVTLICFKACLDMNTLSGNKIYMSKHPTVQSATFTRTFIFRSLTRELIAGAIILLISEVLVFDHHSCEYVRVFLYSLRTPKQSHKLEAGLLDTRNFLLTASTT